MQSPGCWRAFAVASIQALMSPLARLALAPVPTLPLQVTCLDASTGSSRPAYGTVMQMVLSTGKMPGSKRWEQQPYVWSSHADVPALLPAQVMGPEALAGCTFNQAL